MNALMRLYIYAGWSDASLLAFVINIDISCADRMKLLRHSRQLLRLSNASKVGGVGLYQ